MDNMVTTLKSARKPNIEILRIISMIMIIAHHLVLYSGAEFDTAVITVNRLWYQFLIYGGHVGVNVFVLISGYFMIGSKGVKYEKIVRLWLQMLFYSLVIYLLLAVIFSYPIGAKYIAVACIPFMYKQWPFASAYLLLCVFGPFINILLRRMSKNQYRLMLAFMTFFFVIIPTLTTFDGGSNYFVWMIVIYSVGAYIKRFPEEFAKSSRFYILMSAFVALLTFMLTLVFDIVGLWMPLFGKYATHFSGIQHINIVAWAILIFLGCSKMDPTSKAYAKCGGFINSLSALMFGVYLFHEEYFARETIWRVIFDNSRYAKSAFFVLITIGEIIAVFAVGVVIELIRQKLLEPIVMKPVAKITAKLQQKADEILKNE